MLPNVITLIIKTVISLLKLLRSNSITSNCSVCEILLTLYYTIYNLIFKYQYLTKKLKDYEFFKNNPSVYRSAINLGKFKKN
jgi:hypothetical protein